MDQGLNQNRPGHPDLATVLQAQRRYYALRAGEYDEAYSRTGQHDRGEAANASWNADMAQLSEAFDRVDLGGDVIELAAGTGAWTQRLVGRVDSLTALDASAEILAENRRRLGLSSHAVTYEVVDLFEWRPSRRWNGCVFGFWLAKVPEVLLGAFLQSVSNALQHGGTVCCVDKTAKADPPTEYQTRVLNDGRQFTIIDHPRTPRRIIEAFAAAEMRVRVETFGARFSLTSGTRT